MATTTIDKAIVEDLIKFKLKRVQMFIAEILDRWKETSASLFIEKARIGIYEEAENDAIELRQLLAEENKLKSLLQNI